MKIAMVLTVLFSVFLMGNAMASEFSRHTPRWDEIPTHEERFRQFQEENHRKAARARAMERHWGEIDYRNRHNHIYVTGCHHYSESCRMQLRD